MLAQAGERWADWNMCDGTEIHEVDHVDVAVLRGDVGVEAQSGTQEGGAMLAGDDDRGAEEQSGNEDDDANVFAAGGHGSVGHRLVDFAMEDVGDAADFVGERGEFAGDDGLDTVGERLFGVVVDFDHEAVGAGGDGG